MTLSTVTINSIGDTVDQIKQAILTQPEQMTVTKYLNELHTRILHLYGTVDDELKLPNTVEGDLLFLTYQTALILMHGENK